MSQSPNPILAQMIERLRAAGTPVPGMPMSQRPSVPPTQSATPPQPNFGVLNQFYPNAGNVPSVTNIDSIIESVTRLAEGVSSSEFVVNLEDLKSAQSVIKAEIDSRKLNQKQNADAAKIWKDLETVRLRLEDATRGRELGATTKKEIRLMADNARYALEEMKLDRKGLLSEQENSYKLQLAEQKATARHDLEQLRLTSKHDDLLVTTANRADLARLAIERDQAAADSKANLENLKAGNKIDYRQVEHRYGMARDQQQHDLRMEREAAKPEVRAANQALDTRVDYIKSTTDRLLKEIQNRNYNLAELQAVVLAKPSGVEGGKPVPESTFGKMNAAGVPGADIAIDKITNAYNRVVDEAAESTFNEIMTKHGSDIHDPAALKTKIKAKLQTANGKLDSYAMQEIIESQLLHPSVVRANAEARATGDALKVVKGFLGSELPDVMSAEAATAEALKKPSGTYKTADEAGAAAHELRVKDHATKQAAENARAAGAKRRAGIGGLIAAPLVMMMLGKAFGNSDKSEGTDPRVLRQLMAEQVMQQKAGLEMDGKQLANLNRMLAAIQKLKDIQGAQVMPVASPGIV